uniref:Protein kinase domain-containing protein n=1 Tax=Elaeophora elaphi TaxID=1147741 RepID=A0A0R3RSK3_9BILA
MVDPKIFHTRSYRLDIGRSPESVRFGFSGVKLNARIHPQDFELTTSRKREEIKIGCDVLLTMDIGTNELTRPFRIPRRRAGENNAADGIPDKSFFQTKRLRLGGQSDSRSPLASTSSLRKNDSAFSSRIVPLTKKKLVMLPKILFGFKFALLFEYFFYCFRIVQDHQQTPTHSRKSKPGELFDRILDSMVNPPKERKKDAPQDDVDEAGPSGVTTNVSSSPPKRSTSGLTREDLERHQNDDSSCYAFMQREGLMERLLGHKMLTGRVDSHVVLGFLPFDPKDNLPPRNRKNVDHKVLLETLKDALLKVGKKNDDQQDGYNIPATLSHAAVTPSASAAAPYTNQSTAFALYPGPSSQQLPPTTAAFAAGNQYPPTTLAHSSHYSSANINVNNSNSSTVKVNNHPAVMLPPTVLHPYASATNYNISGTSVASYSIPTTSYAATTASGSLTTATVSPVQQQLHQQPPKPLVVPNSSFGRGSHQSGTGTYSTANSNCNFSELRTSQNPYRSQYQTTNYSPPLQHHQHQKQQHQNSNLSGTSPDGTAGGSTFNTQHQQLQPDEKSFSTNFSRPPTLQLQTSRESLPTSSSATFNGGEAGSSRFLPSSTIKAESVSINAAVTSGYNSDHPGGAVNNASANFGSSKSSDEPVSVPSSQNVIKTLLSALSIPQSSDSAATGSVVPHNSASAPEIGDGDREVDFCWPPANIDARWSHESGPSVSEKAKKTILHQPSSSCAQAANASRMMFFDQPVKIDIFSIFVHIIINNY